MRAKQGSKNYENAKCATSWQNQQNGMCAQQRLRSDWADAQSDQSSLSAWRNLGFLATHWAHREDSDQIGPLHNKTNKMTCAPSEASDQPGHPPSLIKVFTVRLIGSEGPSVSSCGQRRLWSDWADVQADLSLCWAHRSFCYVMLRPRIVSKTILASEVNTQLASTS